MRLRPTDRNVVHGSDGGEAWSLKNNAQSPLLGRTDRKRRSRQPRWRGPEFEDNARSPALGRTDRKCRPGSEWRRGPEFEEQRSIASFGRTDRKCRPRQQRQRGLDFAGCRPRMWRGRPATAPAPDPHFARRCAGRRRPAGAGSEDGLVPARRWGPGEAYAGVIHVLSWSDLGQWAGPAGAGRRCSGEARKWGVPGRPGRKGAVR
jgi:hypothetical protein